jgi:hypothetical protein
LTELGVHETEALGVITKVHPEAVAVPLYGGFAEKAMEHLLPKVGKLNVLPPFPPAAVPHFAGHL